MNINPDSALGQEEPGSAGDGQRPTAEALPADRYVDRELSWLAFAGRVLALVEDDSLPLLERVKFAGIMGMLHDEFFMKRINGIKRRIRDRSNRISMGGRTAQQQLADCRRVILRQVETLSTVLHEEILPALAAAGLPIHDLDDLDAAKKSLQEYFHDAVQPILTPLAVDAEHPFPFISNGVVNLALRTTDDQTGQSRFVRIKCPENRPRWVPLPDRAGVVPLEQVIAAFVGDMFPARPAEEVYFFRVTRGASGHKAGSHQATQDDSPREPGCIIREVSDDLRERRFAEAVRLEVDCRMPQEMVDWIAVQVGVGANDVYRVDGHLAHSDLLKLPTIDRDDLCARPHEPATHPRLRHLGKDDAAVFEEIDRGDILLHHPYHSFDSSVLRFIQQAAVDPKVLAIKLTIYRTNQESPIVQALAEASRCGKQVAVLVEITARFDEAPNIAWGKYLENEGVHVAYGMKRLKTHVKLALVVREEGGQIRRYAHVGTGNYHSDTARIYEDIGVLTSNPEICADVASVFNDLTAATHTQQHHRMLVAPVTMRARFVELIRREAEHAREGRPCGIDAKMNQLEDPEIIDELYLAGQAGVPIRLVVRGLCCLKPRVPGLSDNISVFSVLGRFLEHSRIYRFQNGGDPVYFIGSADWMRRNLTKRVETIIPVLDREIRQELADILKVYFQDNTSSWEGQANGSYRRRCPADGEPRRATQEIFIQMAENAARPAEQKPRNPAVNTMVPMPDDFG